MKSDVIIVSNKNDQIEQALVLAEKVAQYKELPAKGVLRLRLLTEEVMSLVRAITGDFEGKFWIEDEDNEFQLHLQTLAMIDPDQKKLLISVASSGKNEAAKGLLGKIQVFFEPLNSVSFAMDMMALDASDEYSSVFWSMRSYEEELYSSVQAKKEGSDEAWDELEKSVIAALADDVKVGVTGNRVEMTVFVKL
ncbi:MAG: hypothetical protein IIY77_06840 [Lachnospiraceae bacterium]|nr:hypothetical protein [Lachnospiraceae bacterium]